MGFNSGFKGLNDKHVAVFAESRQNISRVLMQFKVCVCKVTQMSLWTKIPPWKKK